MARINKTQFALLGCLSMRSMSAYEMKEFISQTISHFWSEGEGQIYPTLKKLTDEDLVTFEEQEASKAGTKKVYSLTPEGSHTFLEWLKSKADRPIYRNELILKLFFGYNQAAKFNIKLIDNVLAECESELEFLNEIKATLAAKPIPAAAKTYSYLVLDYGIVMLSAEINWCKNSIKQLEEVRV